MGFIVGVALIIIGIRVFFGTICMFMEEYRKNENNSVSNCRNSLECNPNNSEKDDSDLDLV